MEEVMDAFFTDTDVHEVPDCLVAWDPECMMFQEAEVYEELFVLESPPVVGGEVFEGADGEEQEELECCNGGILWSCYVKRVDEPFNVWRDSDEVCELFEFVRAIVY